MKTAFILLSISMAAVAQPTGQVHAPQLLTIEGVTVDAISGAAAPGAYVAIFVSSGRVVSRTDASGHFRLDLQTGPLLMPLSIAHPGYVLTQRLLQKRSSVPSNWQFPEPMRRELANLRIELTPAARLTGMVVDEDGIPVHHATVQALRYRVEDGERKLTSVASAESNDLGGYRLGPLEPGAYHVRLSLETLSSWDRRYVAQYFTDGLQPDDTRMLQLKVGQQMETRIKLSRYEGVTVSGRLRPSPEAARLKTVNLTFRFGGDPETRFAESTVVNGQFLFRHVPPGVYRLNSYSDWRQPVEFGSVMASASVQIGSTNVNDILLEPRAVQPMELAGTIVVQGGAPPPRMTVALITNQGRSATAHSDENGEFVLTGLTPGHYDLRTQFDSGIGRERGNPPGTITGMPISAQFGSAEVLKSGFDLDAATASPLRITLPRLAKVQGTLVDGAGRPITDESITFISFQPGGRGGSTTDKDGSFGTYLRPGDYHAYILPVRFASNPLLDAEYQKAHENDFPAIHVIPGDNPRIRLARSGN